jgi:hypothetical protein
MKILVISTTFLILFPLIFFSGAVAFSQIGLPYKLGLASPLKQFQSGIKAQDVKCQPSFPTLVIKTRDGSPACLSLSTALNLVERGWGTMIYMTNSSLSSSNETKLHVIKIIDTKLSINYTITGGKIIGAKGDFNNTYKIILSISTNQNGSLVLELPIAGSLAANGCDNDISITEDGKQVYAKSGQYAQNSATLRFDFVNGTKQIVLVGECGLA